LHLIARERLPEERLQVSVGIESPMRAQGMLPLVEAQGVSAALVGAPPRFVDRCFSVDDESVEIQDDGRCFQRFLVR
jgi:hypothetical protein